MLLDFGLTSEIESDTGYGTRPLNDTAQWGSAGYAPLEQYGRHSRLQPATDIYALGATLYHLLTGKMPIPATERAAGDILATPQSINIRVPQFVGDAVMSAMDMDVTKRPQDVAQFLAKLDRHQLVVGDSGDVDTAIIAEENPHPNAANSVGYPCSECGAPNSLGVVMCSKCGSWLIGANGEHTTEEEEHTTQAASNIVPGEPLPEWVKSQVSKSPSDSKPSDAASDRKWWRS